MTVLGIMGCYRCDHPGCEQNVTVAEHRKQATGWQFATDEHNLTGKDFCPDHRTIGVLHEFLHLPGGSGTAVTDP